MLRRLCSEYIKHKNYDNFMILVYMHSSLLAYSRLNLIPVIEALKFHANEWKTALGLRLAESTKHLMLEFRDRLMVSFYFY
jgi:hypothetical protein